MKLGIIRSVLLAGMCVAGAAMLNSCKPPQPVAVEEPEPPAPATPVPATTPPPATPIAAATPVPDPLAPPGIFFLLQKASITTDEGIVGLKPGQGLRQVSPGTYEVNGRTIQLPDHHVTNNLRIARQFASSDATAQAAIRQNLQQTSAAKAAAEAQANPQRPTSATGQATGTPRYLSGVNKQSSGLESSSTLGAGHTRTKDGYLWQKDASGNWVVVRRLGK